MIGLLRSGKPPELQNPVLLVGWGGDTGRLGSGVTDHIIRKLDCSPISEIDPEEYFSLGGVTVEDDLVEFPESKFFACPSRNLLVFQSATPSYEYYKFFNQILDMAQQYGNIRFIYAIGGMISLSPHTIPRQLLGTFNSAEAKRGLDLFDIDIDSDYETPPGQKPTLNSYFLWTARRRNINAMGLWTPVPFYLMSLDDTKSQKRIIEFLNARLRLKIDLDEFDRAIIRQNQKINEIRNLNPEVDSYISRLESNLTLTEDENMKLVKEIEEYLKEKSEI